MYLKNVDVIIISVFERTMSSRTAGPYRLATELRKNNYTCQIIDAFNHLTHEQRLLLLSEIVGDRTKIVGFSTTFMVCNTENFTYQFPDPPAIMQEYFALIKNKNSKTKIIIGGSKACYPIKDNYIDAVIYGYADRAVIEYLKFLNNKNPFFMYDIDSAGKILINGNNYNNNFDFSNSQIIYENCDNILNDEAVAIEISRGCIFKCKFCAFPLNGKNKNDYIKYESILKSEFLYNYEKFGITRYMYMDDTHNDNLYKLEVLARIAQSLPFKLEYSCYLRLDLIHAHQEQYELLKNGGLIGAFFGIETLNHESGKIVGKGLHPDKIIEELHKFQKLMPEVATSSGFIVGLPKETKETVTKWVDIICDEKFPLDEINIFPLFIQHEALYLSDFEINKKKWYTYHNEQDKYNWHNGDFDFNWACQFTKNIMESNKLFKKQRISSWSATAWPEYRKKLLSLHLNDIQNMQKKFVEGYIQKLFTN